MGTTNFLLEAFALAICFNACLSQNFTSNAKACSDCNSTADCNPKKGYVLCSCKSGYVGNGLNCTKLVFCDRTCCPPGYTWDATRKSCVDVNECQTTSMYTCLTQSQCFNKNGIYVCNATANPLCPTTTCGAGQDCVRSGSGPEVECIDPCENYTEIDGSQRLYTINSVGRFPTDRYLFGWYRYANNLRLREGFVGALKCGSVQPYSLSNHPTVSEGVKSVSLLTNGLAMNTTGPSILVKACPAGYYVYKFSGLMTFEVYCTDLPPTTTSMTTTTTPPTTTTTPTTITSTAPETTTTTTIQPTSISNETSEPTTIITIPPLSNSTATSEPSTTTTIPPPSNSTATTEPTTITTIPPTSEPTTTTTIPPLSNSTETSEPSTTTTIPPPSNSTTTTEPTTITTIPPTSEPTTTTTIPPTSTSLTTESNPLSSTSANATTTPCTNTTTQAPVIPTTLHITEENITVTAVQSKSTLSVRILTQIINNKEVKSLEINETTVVNIDMRTISSSHIYIKTTKSISPTSILILIGSDGPQTFSNATDTVVTTTESTIPNTSSPTAYCSKPAETSTVTETAAIAGNTCSKVTSASTTTTITTTEEVIVLGPDGFAKSCTYF